MWGPGTGSPGFRGGEVSLPNSGLPSGQRGLGPPCPSPPPEPHCSRAWTSLCLCGGEGAGGSLGQQGNQTRTPDDGGGGCCPRSGPPSAQLHPSGGSCPLNTHTVTHM